MLGRYNGSVTGRRSAGRSPAFHEMYGGPSQRLEKRHDGAISALVNVDYASLERRLLAWGLRMDDPCDDCTHWVGRL